LRRCTNSGLKAYMTMDPDRQQKAEEAVAPVAIVALASTEGYASESQSSRPARP
jgi:membrane peptidoglycan carboxypeptidase